MFVIYNNYLIRKINIILYIFILTFILNLIIVLNCINNSDLLDSAKKLLDLVKKKNYIETLLNATTIDYIYYGFWFCLLLAVILGSIYVSYENLQTLRGSMEGQINGEQLHIVRIIFQDIIDNPNTADITRRSEETLKIIRELVLQLGFTKNQKITFLNSIIRDLNNFWLDYLEFQRLTLINAKGSAIITGAIGPLVNQVGLQQQHLNLILEGIHNLIVALNLL